MHDSEGKPVLCQNREPWEEAVSGTELLDALVATFKRYLVLPEHAAEVLALWVVLTYAHDAFEISPLLVVTSPQKQCGKTLLLTVLGELVSRPLPASNITAAALFRAVERWTPTLLVDEADTFLRESDELRGIINSGHRRASAYVVRTVGDEHEPQHFRTWAPKALAAIGSLHPTLEDRAIPVGLQRKGPGEHVERLRLREAGPELWRLARKAARWANDHSPALAAHVPAEIDGLHNRAQDKAEPLMAIAELAGSDWPAKARRALRAILEATEDASREVLLLSDLQAVWPPKKDRAPTKDLLELLHGLEDRPWSAYGRTGKPMQPVQLARLLKPFGVKPRTLQEGEGRTTRTTAKGYYREEMAPLWDRYLPSAADTPDPGRHTDTPAGSLGNPASLSVTQDEACDGTECEKAEHLQVCDGVTDQEGGPGEGSSIPTEPASLFSEGPPYEEGGV